MNSVFKAEVGVSVARAAGHIFPASQTQGRRQSRSWHGGFMLWETLGEEGGPAGVGTQANPGLLLKGSVADPESSASSVDPSLSLAGGWWVTGIGDGGFGSSECC